MAATHVGVDPDEAVDAVIDLVELRGDELGESAADALVEQLLAGVDLGAAVSAVRDAEGGGA